MKIPAPLPWPCASLQLLVGQRRADVRRAAGLDTERSWIVLSEFNEFLWPGFDLRFIPGANPPTAAYGFLPPGFFGKVRNQWLALYAASKSGSVSRDS